MDKLYHVENSMSRHTNGLDPDQTAYEPPNRDLRCMLIQLVLLSSDAM